MTTTDVIPLIEQPTTDYYERQAQQLFDACKSIDNEVINLVNKYHPFPDKLIDINKPSTNFSLDDARLVIARRHGFEDIARFNAHIKALGQKSSDTRIFELAADFVVEGEAEYLADFLHRYPHLAKLRSGRAHNATLLHYVTANGVENFRQRTPDNIVDIAGILLKAGSEPDAGAKVFYGTYTPLDLLVSSCHPADNGTQVPLVHSLVQHGAAVNGLANDGSPIVTALSFNYLPAAWALVQLGARVDTAPVAAALGLTDLLKSFLNKYGELRASTPLIKVSWLRMEKTHAANLELAFVWAGMFNRTEVLSLLLEKGVSPAARDCRQWTALHWAGYHGHLEATQLLLAHKAPLEARNEFGGTVLDQTLWATSNEALKPSHPEIIWKLLEAGAKVHAWWLFDNLTPPLDPAIAALVRSFALLD